MIRENLHLVTEEPVEFEGRFTQGVKAVLDAQATLI